MKFWVSARIMPSNPNYHRLILSYTLHSRCDHLIQYSSSYYPRRKLRMASTSHTRQWSLYILHCPVPPCRTRDLLFIVYLYNDLNDRSLNLIFSNSNCFHRVCINLRTNVILSRHSNYKFIVSNPLYRFNISTMNLGGIRGR